MQGLFSRFGHKIGENAPVSEFFSPRNVDFIRTFLLKKHNRKILPADVYRIMGRVYEERLESVPRMNERVIMYILNDVRTYDVDRLKRLNWEENFFASQNAYDKNSRTTHSFDQSAIKISNRLGQPHVGGTVNFYFTHST